MFLAKTQRRKENAVMAYGQRGLNCVLVPLALVSKQCLTRFNYDLRIINYEWINIIVIPIRGICNVFKASSFDVYSVLGLTGHTSLNGGVVFEIPRYASE